MPASNLASAGMSRHLRPRNGAGESFVSFIRLFGGTPRFAPLQNHLANNCCESHGTEGSAVAAGAPVISHDEECIAWQDQFV